ncbi:MAG: glutathione transport system substrate-binding protein [Frankiales bacterium]|jgi:peptide/nickel transport system substrate-binding protein|nr:glutathione transport system substrate-binding protein [Frankiales bacterium]
MNRRLYSGAVIALTAALSVSACSGKSSTGATQTTASGTSASTGAGAPSATTGASSTSAATPSSGGTGNGNIPAKSNKPAAAFAACDKAPLTCNTGTAVKGGTYTYTIEKDIQDWNILTSTGNTFDTAEALNQIEPYAYVSLPDLSFGLSKDYFTSVEQTSASPQTIVYKINPKAVWNDGVPFDAKDMILTWKLQDDRVCGGADPNDTSANPNLFCDPASSAGYNQIKTLTPSADGKTLTLVFDKPFSDWKSLFGPIYPAHIGDQHGSEANKAGLSKITTYFSNTVPTWSAGPYMISKFQKNTAVTEVPNPKWFGAAGPNFDTLVFRIITDATQETPALQSGEVNAINPQPEVDLVKSVQSQKGILYHIGGGLIWEHFDFNLKNPSLKDTVVRTAMFTALNREALIKRTVGQFDPNVKAMDNHMFVPGQAGYVDNTPAGLGTGDAAAAAKLLTGAGYKITGGKLIKKDGTPFPALTARYTVGNNIRLNELQEFARDVKKIGITINIKSTESLGGSLSHKAGLDYDIIVFAWQSSPAAFQGAIQTWLSTSASNYGFYKDPQVDKLLIQAAGETDDAKARAELNAADKILSAAAYVMPLYQKPTFLAFGDNSVNIRDNASLSGPPYNVSEWGFGHSTTS